jgi:hypothetical protein
MANLKKEMLTTKPTLALLALVAAVAVLSVGYIMALAILAPQQLAEATAAATDLICDKCVGTSDIADSAVTSAKIGSGQVANGDIGPSAVTSPKIKDFEVGNGDLGTDAVTSTKIKNGEVKTEDLASGAIQLNVHTVIGEGVTIAPGDVAASNAECPAGEILTGGGFVVRGDVKVTDNIPLEEQNLWHTAGINEGADDGALQAFARCVGPSP